MKTKGFIILSFLAFIITSCNEPLQRIARSVGATSEILVVNQELSQWEGEAGQAVRNYFGQEQYGLPQGEPRYKITTIHVSKLSDMFKKHRNLFIMEIDPKLKEAVVDVRYDLWAKPQRVIKVAAPDTPSWLAAFEAQKAGFMALYDQSERERLINIFRPTAKLDVMEEVYKQLKIKLLVPEGFYVAKTEPGFMWIRKETNEFSQAFLLMQRPYLDTADFSLNRIIRTRDSLVMKYIPGPTEGTFMSTDKEFILPVARKISDFSTDFAVETRGIWNVPGDFMAGPFVSYTFVHPETKMLITAEGYVYAPNKDKRDHLRQLEALLYSISFLNESLAKN